MVTCFIFLSHNGYLAHHSLVARGCGRLHHIHARGHLAPFQVASVPSEGAAVAAAIGHEHAVGSSDFDICIVAESRHGDKSREVRPHGVGIGPHVVFGHGIVGGGGIADVGAEAHACAEEHFARLLVNGY